MLRVLLTIGLLQFFTMLVMLVRTKVLALLLGPEYLGVMGVIDKLLAVVSQTLSLSMPFAAIRFLPAKWQSDPREFALVMRKMRNLVLILIVPATMIGALVAFWNPALLGAELVPYRSALLAGFAALPVLAMVPFIQNVYAGRMQQYRAMWFALVHAIVFTVTAIVGVWWRGLAGFYIAYAVCGLALVWWGYRETSRLPEGAVAPKTRPLDVSLPPVMWRFSGALLLLTFVMPYAALTMQRTVLGDYGALAAGWMQAAIGISLSVRGLLGSAHPVFLTPGVNRNGTPQERMAWAGEFQKTFALLAGMSVPALLLFPQLAIRLLYSSAFLPGAPFVMLFVMAEVFMLFAGTYQSLVVAFDRMGFHVVQNVSAQLVLLAIAVYGIPRWGIEGAGLAAVAAPIFLYTSTTIFLRRAYGLKVPARHLALSGYVAVSMVSAGLLGARLPEWSLGGLGIKLAFFVLQFAGLSLFLTPGDRARIRSAVGGLRARRIAPNPS